MAERGLTKDELIKLIADTSGPIVSEIVEAQFKQLADAQKAAMAAQADASQAYIRTLVSGGVHNGSTGEQPAEKGIVTARLIRALAAGRMDLGRAADFSKKNWPDPVGEIVTKALTAGDATAGGFLVPPQFSRDIIELLRPAAVVRSMGPLVVPMPTGTVRIPKLTAGVAASYIGENQAIGVTQPTFGQIALTWKKLSALVPISNDLLRFNQIGADTIVRTDLVRAMAQREDQAFIRDNGTDATPRGLRFWAPAANVLTANTTVNLANVSADLGFMIVTMKNANVPMTKPGWLMAPRTWNFLMTLQNANGFFVFRPEMSGGTLWGFPFKMTTQIPTNIGALGTGSELYLVDFDDVAIGDAETLRLDVSTEAMYVDGGQSISAFQQDQTLIRAIAEHDFAVRRDVAVVILNDVRWI